MSPSAGELSFNLDRQPSAVLRSKRPRLLRLTKRQRKEIMNWKKFFFTSIAAFIFIFFWGWLYNGVLLKDVLAQAQSLFRPREEIMGLFQWIVIGDAGLALSFVMIYASGFAGGGIAAGVRLGIMLEILAVSARCMIYATQPFPAKLLVLASIGGFIEMIVTGIMVGAIYKPKPNA
jgi:magnesium-transporting ATPase (P-type)